mgnify:CR=1 FL=1
MKRTTAMLKMLPIAAACLAAAPALATVGRTQALSGPPPPIQATQVLFLPVRLAS